MKIPDLLSNAVARCPGRLCVTDGDRALTFAEVDARADRLAQAFAARGLDAGDRVALLALTELEHLEIQVAALRAEVILVPLNFRLARPELEAILEDCEPRLLIHGPELAQPASEAAVERVWHLGSEGVGDAYDSVLAQYEPRLERAPLDHRTVNSILYTSGTTGAAKGAMLSNGTLWARVNFNALEVAMVPGDVFLFPMPMFHVSAHLAYAFTYRGCTLALMRSFDAAEVIERLERHRATHAVLVPTMIGRVLELLADRPARLDALRLLIYGASPIAPDVLRRAMSLLGCDFFQGYGLTEAFNASILRPADHDPERRPELLTSCGTASISNEVRVVSPDGRELGPGEVGEVVISGPSVMDGYWNAPAATAAVLRDGWMHTGDLGYRSADGYLHLTDRLKDVIVSGGENVYSREVEDALYGHDAVLEAAVIGIPSSEWGESVHGVVVLHDGAHAEPHELIGHCRERLARYKAPKSVDIVAELPKNASGKILKGALRERYWQGAQRAIG